MKRKVAFALLLLVYSLKILSQEYVQDIRGVVTDNHTGIPLPGATIVLTSLETLTGVTTGAEGRFLLSKVPVGRHSIRVSYMGYKPHEISNFLVGTGKENYFEIRLEESVQALDEVLVRYKTDKEKPLNEMVAISARMFTIEETERYAGSVGDPARMASNFAGVNTINDQSNSLTIRGNSPFGMLWILEGIDIPNPSHFGAMGGTGGAISMLNNNTLSNSDFLTGAFPAQYGNALSGVFDLKMRQGNTQKYEFMGQVAFNGLEVGLEGPLSKDKHTSFLVNYRYSTLGVLDKIIGMENLALVAVPYYQDLSLKANIYNGRLGRVTFFGLGGYNFISITDGDKDPDSWTHSIVGQNLKTTIYSGVAGITHHINFGTSIKLESTLATSHAQTGFRIDTLTRAALDIAPQHRHFDREQSIALNSKFTYKPNPKNIFMAGVYFQPMNFSFNDSIFQSSTGRFKPVTSYKGNYSLSKLFTQWKHNFTDEISIISGVNVMHFTANSDLSLEPRVGLRWGFRSNQSLGLAAGLHGHLAPRLFYVVEEMQQDGSFAKSNENLKFTRSFHLVAGYDILIKQDTRLKIETYYQHHFNVPVLESLPGWSLLNYGSEWIDFVQPTKSLVNTGTGDNIGIELTLERFLNKGYYYLITTSLFDSKYKGYDGISHNSAFNGNFIINTLIGKEIKIKDRNVFFMDGKMVWAGGKPYTPFSSMQVSEFYHVRIDDWDKAFSLRRNDFFRINLRLGYRINLYNTTHELALDIYNLTNRKNIFMEYFDPITGDTNVMYQFTFFPVVLYRVQF